MSFLRGRPLIVGLLLFVLAVVVAVFWGITATLLVGLTAYVVALLCLRSGRSPDFVSTNG